MFFVKATKPHAVEVYFQALQRAALAGLRPREMTTLYLVVKMAKYATAMRYVGYVGIGFSALHSINEINEACSVGRENECTKKEYTEVGRFSGGGYSGGEFLSDQGGNLGELIYKTVGE